LQHSGSDCPARRPAAVPADALRLRRLGPACSAPGVRYATAAALRAALEQRLLAASRRSGAPLVPLRELVTFERLLARLMSAVPDRPGLEH
jgi:hypothetical protein